jgi:hypothetical protein
MLVLALAGGLLLAACASQEDPVGEEPAEEEAAAADVSSGEEEAEETSETASEGPAEFDPQITMPDGQVSEMLDTFTLSGIRSTTLDAMVDSGDARFIVPLIELQRFFSQQQRLAIGLALDELTGQEIGTDWAAWMRWAAEAEPPLPPNYAGWKADQLAIIDPEFRRFIYEDVPTTIRLDEVVWGGVAVDGIPALDNPTQISPDEADYIMPEELVFGVAIDGDVRAYPLRIMNWHEMFNDVVGGTPVSLAYCTLCGAGILYDTTVDGEVYTFGSSGFLFRSNKLMYDRNTDSLWNQLTGEPVTGPLVGSGIKLDILPVTLTTWEDWLSDHPDTTVLSLDTGFTRVYEVGAAYGEYFASPETMFPVAGVPDDLLTKDLVYALNLDNTPKAYPLDLLAEERVTNDTLAGQEVVLVTSDAPELIQAEPGGAAVRAYERGGHTFAPAPDGADNTVVDETGQTWQVTEDAMVNSTGETLPRVPGHVAYWFGWSAFYPDTLVYEG